MIVIVSKVLRTGDTVLGEIALTFEGSSLSCMLLLELTIPLTETLTLAVVVPLWNLPVMHLIEVEETAITSH